MSRYTVVIKNRYLDEQTVARIKTYDDKNKKFGFTAKELAEYKAKALNELIDNDIYFSDIEEEGRRVMKKEDFKDIFNHVFMKTIDNIIKNKSCHKISSCNYCPFSKSNSIKNEGCGVIFLDDLTENAKEFKAMVEEKMQDIKYYKEMKLDVINTVVEMTLEDGTEIEERAVKFWKNDEGSYKIGDIQGLDGFYRAIMFKLVEEKKKDKPFELKEGMKFKTIDFEGWSELLRGKIFTLSYKSKDRFGRVLYHIKEYTKYFYVENIDLEATKKLNEVKEELKEEPKNEKFVIWNPKGSNPRVIHNSLKDAEKEAERLATSNPNEEFYVMKALKKVKGQVKIEWEK